ncbi:MAG: homoserine dehydrogenase, partial [Thermoplasmata archaeon]|nr:homoserine dehydrogenase [Thermoplasmata archaeon]
MCSERGEDGGVHGIIMIGCGVVGQGFLRILADKSAYLEERYGFKARVVAISDKLKGAIMVEKGLDLPRFLEHLENGGRVDTFPAEGAVTGLDPVETIRRAPGDIVVEVSYTDIKTGEPAATYMREALSSGKHVATTNKGPPALFYRELDELARKNGVLFKHEGVVMSGTPIFNLLDYCLAGNEIREIRGILNGTTNFILTKMEEDNMAYEDALALAQKLGYAEADPTADVEGYDALAKVVVLGNIVMGGSLKPEDVPREGITGITSEDIKRAAEEGMRYKLIGRVRRREDGDIEASVAPVKLPLTDPLAGVGGAMNALTFTTDLSGEVT